MIAHPIASFFFALENLGIVLGYLFIAVKVAPLFLAKVGVRSQWTKVGGIGFFLLCGTTHAWLAWSAVSATDHAGMATSWPMHAVHILQAIAVWVFVGGLYIELTDVNWRPREERGDAP